ncbi:MAG: NfeD family protein [Clostridiales Family XIII bacterium]|jgi:membrane protein implicated in regulation of membrane protease activity|nr:NfeD family protein [Clostridiales Family XIII bacterium]
MEWLLSNLVICWIILAVVFAVIEAAVSGLVTIWFVIGAGAAAVCSLAGMPVPGQIAVFFGVSIVLLVFTRPILVKKLKLVREKNYTEQLEGKTGLVVEAIKPFSSGQVKVRGIVWTAVGETEDLDAAKGSHVEILRIEGVKLIVKKLAES